MYFGYSSEYILHDDYNTFITFVSETKYRMGIITLSQYCRS